MWYRHKKGIGLLEVLIYIAIVTLLTVIVINTTTIVIAASGKDRLKKNILGEAGIAVERIVREIRLADSVDVPGSVFGEHPGILKLNTIVSSGDPTPTTREFSLKDGLLRLREGTSEPMALTEKVVITNLVFYYSDNGEISEAITLELTAEDKLKNITETHIFNTTAVLRRSY